MEYFITRSNRPEEGPFNNKQIKDMVESGYVQKSDFIRTESSGWTNIGVACKKVYDTMEESLVLPPVTANSPTLKWSQFSEKSSSTQAAPKQKFNVLAILVCTLGIILGLFGIGMLVGSCFLPTTMKADMWSEELVHNIVLIRHKISCVLVSVSAICTGLLSVLTGLLINKTEK